MTLRVSTLPWRRRLPVLSVIATLLVTIQGVTVLPARAATPKPPGRVWSPPQTPLPALTPVTRAKVHALVRRVTAPTPPAYHPPVPALPDAGQTTVSLAGARIGGAKTGHDAPRVDDLWVGSQRVGSSPLYLTPRGAATRLSVTFAGASAAHAAGIGSGVIWALSGATSATSVQLGVDTSALRGVAGGNYADRLEIVTLPACALSTPARPACQRQSPVAVSTDAATGRLVATVAIPPASGAGNAVVFAVASAPAGSAGNYAATPTQPSNQWSQGGATGGFSYSYPVSVPPALGGSAPDVTLAYSSQMVDGMTASTNTQSSWIGSGWDYQPGYIERAYQSCSDDGISGSGDSCWAYGGAEVTLDQAGMGGALVTDDSGHAWHLADDNGATIKLVTNSGATGNGAYNGEYWVITTQDGTRFYYGAGHLPSAEGGTGADPATHSAFTEPVYCPKSTDPCYSSGTGASSYAANMAYRWNLDYVVDPHGNTTVYTYAPETNYYSRSSAHTLTPYLRGGALQQISYGWLKSDVATETSPTPAAEIRFSTAQRCTGSAQECSSVANLTSATQGDWPDTPFDLICASTGTCNVTSETYFSTVKLTQIQTLTYNGSIYKPVDTYALSSSMPDPGDGTSPSLWLNSVTHTGNDGTAVTLPSVSFGPVQLGNRVPGSLTWPDYNHLRIASITDETGGEISLSYAASTPQVPACSQAASAPVLPTPSTDGMLCYQQYWTPPGAPSPNADWFQKYLVTEVRQTDLVTTGTPDRVVDYTYNGTPAWHRDDSPTTKNTQRTWDVFRGFGSVTTTSGVAPDPITQTTSLYLRGMDGDFLTQTGGATRSVTVGDTLGDQIADADQYADTMLETDTYNQAGGQVQDKSVSLPWSSVTGSHAETGQPGVPPEKAYFLDTGTAIHAELLASAAWRTTRTVNVFATSTGLLAHSDNQGDVSLLGTAGSQEVCTTPTYAAPPTGIDAGMVAYPARTLSVAVGTAGPVGTGACPAPSASNAIADGRVFYDGNTATSGLIGTVGNDTMLQAASGYTGTTPTYHTTESALTYDAYGRSTGSTDARGLVSTLGYQPSTGQLPTQVTTTDTTDHFVSVTTMDQARQLPTKTLDENANATSASYDGLGRLLKTWLPGRSTLSTANITHTYAINGTSAPSYVQDNQLQDNATYLVGYTIMNGFGEPRQTQGESVDGSNGSVVTDTFYDSHGWPVKSTSPYYETSFPSATIFPAADSSIPGETLVTHDGSGRTVTSGFYSYGNLQWRSTAAYPGADRTDTTPPAGGTATSTFTDALGRSSASWSYTTPTPTGSAANARIVSYAYDAAGRQRSITGPAGQQWSFAYDMQGRRTSVTDPDSGTSTISYDPAGDIASQTDGNGQLLTPVYDIDGRITAQYAGTKTTGTLLRSWTYDTAAGGKGQLASATSYSAGATYTESVAGYTNRYAETGLSTTIPTTVPTDERNLAGVYTIGFTYTPITGALATSTYGADGGLPAETVTNSYSVQGVLNNVGGIGSYLTSAQVDPFGHYTRYTMGGAPNQVVQTNDIDAATGRVTEQFLDKQTGTGHVDDIKNLYDAAGMVTATSDVVDGAATDRQCYGYDQLGQLTQAWTDTAGTTTAGSPSVPNMGGCVTTNPTAATIGGPAPYWQTYAYDTSGNRTTETDHDPTGNTTNDIGRTYAYNQGGTKPDQLRSEAHTGPGAGTDSYTLDTAGNTTTRTIAGGPNQTLTYTPLNMTSSVTDTAANTSNYVYDGGGSLLLQRDTHAAATTVTLYLGAEQLTLNTTSNTVTGQRYYGTPGGPTEIRSSTGILTYQFGTAQGSGTVTISANSAQTETRRYFTPYGAPRGTTPPSWVDNHGYLGQPTDSSSGLDLLGARNYDPTTGRFLQRDAVLEVTSPTQVGGYTYAGNNPVAQSDPSGLAVGCVDVCTTDQTGGNGRRAGSGGGSGTGGTGGGAKPPTPFGKGGTGPNHDVHIVNVGGTIVVAAEDMVPCAESAAGPVPCTVHKMQISVYGPLTACQAGSHEICYLDAHGNVRNLNGEVVGCPMGPCVYSGGPPRAQVILTITLVPRRLDQPNPCSPMSFSAAKPGAGMPCFSPAGQPSHCARTYMGDDDAGPTCNTGWTCDLANLLALVSTVTGFIPAAICPECGAVSTITGYASAGTYLISGDANDALQEAASVTLGNWASDAVAAGQHMIDPYLGGTPATRDLAFGQGQWFANNILPNMLSSVYQVSVAYPVG